MMNQVFDGLEQRRLALQAQLDAQKTPAYRNRLGQFATPTALATEILQYALRLFPKDTPVKFLDPAIGTGAFYSALRTTFSDSLIEEAVGFEIDPHYGLPASQLWKATELDIHLTDFTHAQPTPRFNLIVCNPPYVRHHHLSSDEKSRLHALTYSASRMKLSGLAGLYCYFLGLTHAWMADDAIAAWLIPSEFMDVNYGQAVKRYLLNRVTLLHLHRFSPDDVQFTDALVSSVVVWFKNSLPPKDHVVTFSYGGTLLQPNLTRTIPASALEHEPKWTRFPLSETRSARSVPTLSDFFHIKRGLVTGDNNFFVLSAAQVRAHALPWEAFRPIFPSPRYLPDNEILADEDGLPCIEPQLFLLDTPLIEDQIQERFPTLFAYLQEGKARGINERYICRHRSPWYSQESRPPAPIVCTYLGRGNLRHGRPFRFILNHTKATVANVYLAMYPTRTLQQALEADLTLLRRIWEALNQISPEQLLGEGRVYGGGLYKLEPRELANVDASSIADLISGAECTPVAKQLKLL